jgi:uncharacterized RDD family membrane protein YckC
MSSQWYYAQNGQQLGPVGERQLAQLFNEGQLDGSALVWRQGLAEWTPAQQVQELAWMLVPVAQPVNPAQMPQQNLGYSSPNQGYPHAGYPQQGYPQAGGRTLGYAVPNSFGNVQYAGFWLRFCAAFVDGLITGVINIIVGVVVGAIAAAAMANSPQNQAEVFALIVNWIASIVVGWLYSALQESSAAQATLGKRMIGAKVTDLNGQRISFGRATGRHFGKIVSGIILMIGYIMAAFDTRKQALHDKMASTLVIMAR